MKELLKIQCHIYERLHFHMNFQNNHFIHHNMNKVIILRKIHVKMKSFTPPFSTIERNYTFTSQLPMYYMQYKNRKPR